MRILGSEADSVYWNIAFCLLGADVTRPMWRHAGIPSVICGNPDVLADLAKEVAASLRRLSEEAGQRERDGDTEVAAWYDLQETLVLESAFDAVRDAYGPNTARDLARWVSQTQPEGVADSDFNWTLVFGRIATDRPTAEYVSERVPRLPLVAIGAAFGDDADDAVNACLDAMKRAPVSDADRAILALDPSTMAEGEDPMIDPFVSMELISAEWRARSLRDVVSSLMSDEQWTAFRRDAADWPW
jgi:hypothetical protein